MNVYQFFAILRARWLLVLTVLVVVTAAGVVGSLLWPKSYTATASVVVDPKPDPVSAALNPTLASPVFMATQVDILQSPRVAQRVVRDLKLADNPQIREQWRDATNGQGTVEEWLADTLGRSLDVKPSRESNVITLSYKAPDPRFAAALVNAFVQGYVAVSSDMRTNPAKQYSSFFDGRLKEARDGLEAAQAKVTAFQKEHGLMAADERLDVENQRLIELTSQATALNALAAESSSRQVQALGRDSDMLQDVLSNPLLAGLKSDIVRGEANLQALTSRLGDSHPQVIEVRSNLAELRRKLDSETRRVTGGVGVSNTINTQRQGKLRADLEAQRSKLVALKALRDQAQVLQRDVEAAQRTYDALQSRLVQTSLESQNNQTNIAPLSTASVPLVPSSPRLTINSLLSVFAGTMFGVILAIGLELRDRRVRGVEDVAALVGLPVLGVLANGQRRASLTNNAMAPALAAPQRPALR